LRIPQNREVLGKITTNAICHEKQRISICYREHGGLQGRQSGTNDTRAKEKRFFRISIVGTGSHQHSLNVPDSQPSHHPVRWVNGCKTQNNPTSWPQLLVALLHERDDWFVDAALKNSNCCLRSFSSFFAVPDAVDGGNKHSVPVTAEQMVIARLAMAWKG